MATPTIAAMGFTSTSGTRLAGALSLAALALVTYSDFVLTDFWDRNAMLTSIVADVFVLVVGVAVVNEFLASRSRRQWRIVADFALLELSRSSRHVWVQLTEAIGIGSRAQMTREELRELAGDRERAERLAVVAAADPASRQRLHAVVAELVSSSRTTLTGWAPVLVDTPNSSALSSYVELQALLSELAFPLSEEVEGKRPTFEGTGDARWIGSRIGDLIRLGADLERELRRPAGEAQLEAA